MRIKFDRWHHQCFITPSLGITHGRPNGKCLFTICFNWLYFGFSIGFIKKKPGRLYDGRL